MRRGDGLRRRVAGVPVILMARVQDEAEVAGGVGADQRAAVHDRGDPFSRPSEILMLSTAVSIVREGAEDVPGLEALLEWRVSLGVERFGVRHAAGHPEHDDGVGGGLNLFLCLLGAQKLLG